ncbi:golvesin C-terminal-like domain-containing protein [Verrucomicrobiota bacterium sgz303538]
MSTTMRIAVLALMWASLSALSQAQLPDIVLDSETTTGIAPHSITISTGSGGTAWSDGTTATDKHGAYNKHNNTIVGGNRYVQYTPWLPSAGWYRVYLWNTANSTNYASNVELDINTADGLLQPDVNQRKNGGLWNLVGTFRFAAGSSGYVKIKTTRQDGVALNGNVAADAVRFVKVEPEVVIDSHDTAGVALTGVWTTITDPFATTWTSARPAVNSNYYHDGNTGQNGVATRSIEFKPNIPVAGRYQVYVTWVADPTNSPNAHIDVYNAGPKPLDPAYVDQREPGYEWVYVGEYQFEAGSNANGRVVISNRYDSVKGETGGRVVVDAVRFVRVPAWEQVIDQSDPEASTTGTGTWTVSGLGNSKPTRLGRSHASDGDPATKGKHFYQFIPNIPTAGFYSVYAWWPDGPTSTRTPIDIIASGAYQKPGPPFQNQSANAGKWNYLGKWWFTAGTNHNVLIRNQTSDGLLNADGSVIADGVAFVRGEDGDEDGMADSWELTYGFNPSSAADASTDADGDGLSNVEEYRAGLDPKTIQTLSYFSGNNQTGPANAALQSVLQVKVSTGAAAAAGAPVTFTIETGGGQVSADGLQWSTSVPLSANPSGIAQVYWRLGKYGSTDNTVRARFGTTQSVLFSARSNDLVGRWRFEEASGTVAEDASGGGNNGVLGNPSRVSPSPSIDGVKALQYDAGVLERNLQLSNTDNRLIPGVSSQPFTLAMWFKIKPNGTTAPNLYTLASNESYLTSGFRFGVDHELSFPTQYYPSDPDKPRLAFWSGQSGGSLLLLQSKSLKTDVWYHVAIVYTGTSGSMYINGQLAATGSGTIVGNTNPINIGGAIGGTRDFNGSIDDVRIYSKALTGAEVAGISNADNDGDGLTDWWKFAYYPSTPANQIDWNADADGDGLTATQEYTNLTDPFDFYNGVTPTISVLSGANQTTDIGGFLTAPVVFEVRRPDGTVWANAPLKAQSPVSGRVVSSTTGQYGTELQVTTNASGQASVLVKAQTSPSNTQVLRATAANKEAKTNVSTTGQVAVVEEWLMDETSGLTTASSKSTNTGTLLGGAGRQSGAKGNALSFAGGTNRVEVTEASPARVNFGKDQSFSIAAWVKMAPNANGPARIVSKGYYGGTSGYFLSTGHIEQGKIAFGVGTGTLNGVLIATQERFDDDLWHHVVAVFDRSTQKASIFVDGEQRKLTKANGTGGTVDSIDQRSLDFSTISNLDASSTETLVFGKHLNQDEPFVGRIDEVRIYGGVLPPLEISTIHTSYDRDLDGLTNDEESVYGTNPDKKNTDDDDLSDLEEILAGRNPVQAAQQVSDANGTTSIVNLELFTPLE